MDLTLPQGHVELRERVRAFVEREVRPKATEREKRRDPLARFPWDIVEAAAAEGLLTLTLRTEHGGGGADELAQALVLEELSAGDMGIAQVLRAQFVYTELFNVVATDAQRARFLPELLENPRCVLAGAMTEPETGSDHSLPYDGVEGGPHTTAVREGDRYRLNGRKTLITSGGVARYYFIWARTDPSVAPRQGTSWFLVPHDTPGLRVGHVYDKLGQRLATNAELIFEDCVIPAGNRFGAHDGAASLGIHSNPALGAAQAIGVARGAYEAALARARWRVQGGRPIIEHPQVAALLAEMAIGLEAARTLVWRSCTTPDPGGMVSLLGMMAKVHATEMAAEVTRRAIQVFGGYGVTEEYPVEKFFRDAATLFHPAAATNQVMLQKIAARLPDDETLSPHLRAASCRYVGEPA
ncbi:Acyl-CoA dehydrogenase, short-chain specific [Baekduia alba]|uniref:acyl-CoA dehydrogenase family protein n=1 Tax=Baekduia alba TaxID=2997333 RepID=UPI0023411E46|nr:acyl-CoA dehydrogenase family protein [Baekduia alba]WCB96866.1 Acyl-CoA dehydrogenase, short-chain specific [Baekduia alba]